MVLSKQFVFRIFLYDLTIVTLPPGYRFTGLPQRPRAFSLLWLHILIVDCCSVYIIVSRYLLFDLEVQEIICKKKGCDEILCFIF